MSQTLPNMLDNTIKKIREMVDVNSVIGTPITTPDGTTIIPVSKVSVGFGGGGSDFTKNPEAFGGGAGGGVKVTPICFRKYHGGPSGGNGARYPGQDLCLYRFQDPEGGISFLPWGILPPGEEV